MTAVRTWHFVIRPKEHSFMWGEFVIVSTGMFAAVSDYGNYAYAWRSIGGADIRKFLLDMKPDSHYFMNKFDPEQIVDWDASEEYMKEEIIRRRREDSAYYTAEQARSDMEAVCASSSPEELVMNLERAYDHFLLEFVHRRLSFDVEAFVNRLCVPYLLPELEKSLKEDP